MQLKQLLKIWFSSQILKRSIKTSIVVGTILAFINHGELILSWSLTPQCWIKMGLTCLVPYSVASWTATKSKPWSTVFVMNFDQNFQSNLLNDIVSRRFRDAEDLVHFVQTRTGKYDSSIITSYWLGREHMINDKPTLSAYVKLECERWSDAKDI